jgi:peptidylprolyl isomerase
MAPAKDGDTVKVHYTGTLDDGTVFDSSAEREPLEFTIGGGNIIPGFEKAVVGMSPDETTTVKVPAAEAYGARQEELAVEVDRSEFGDDAALAVGQRFQVHRPDGDDLVVTVTAVGDEKVTLDGNHPLAGEDLSFEITLVAVS